MGMGVREGKSKTIKKQKKNDRQVTRRKWRGEREKRLERKKKEEL